MMKNLRIQCLIWAKDSSDNNKECKQNMKVYLRKREIWSQEINKKC